MTDYHDPERGHKCPKCGRGSICLVEDGFCDNGGTCDLCIKDAVYERMSRWDYDPDHDEVTA
jgi:hypothetical protein